MESYNWIISKREILNSNFNISHRLKESTNLENVNQTLKEELINTIYYEDPPNLNGNLQIIKKTDSFVKDNEYIKNEINFLKKELERKRKARIELEKNL